MIRRGGHPVIGFGDAGCPSNPPIPTGYVVWRGPVPADVEQWARALLRGVAAPPFGQQWTKLSNGTVVIARKDRLTWAYRGEDDGSATPVTGICIPGITLYRPGFGDVVDPAASPPDPELAVYAAMRPAERPNWSLVASGGVAAATIVGLFFWGMYAAGRR